MIKKNSTIFISLFLLNLYTVAQTNFSWAKSMGASATDHGNSVVVDVSGNVYTTGTYAGTVDFDPGLGVSNLTALGASSQDVFVSKFDAAGNFVWAKSMGGSLGSDEGNAITVDATGNVYVAGQFFSTGDFDPGLGVFTLTSVSLVDGFVCKLDASGAFVWAKSFGASGGDMGFSIVVDPSGNVYTTGYLSGSIFVSKMNNAGTTLWTKTMGAASNNIGRSIAVDAFGNVYTTGYFQITVDFDPGAGIYNMTPVGSWDIFVSKLDASGNFIWAKSFGSFPGYCSGLSLVVDAFGKIDFAGVIQGTVDFDPGPGIYNISSVIGNNTMFVCQLDATGALIWAKSMGEASGGSVAQGIAVDVLGNIYTTGNFNGTVDFNPSLGASPLSSFSGDDVFICSLDNTGNFLWAKQAGGTTNETAYSIAVDNAGSIYATGFYFGTADFDPGAGIYNLVSNGNQDIFVLKLCQIPKQPAFISGNSIICEGSVNTYSIVSVDWTSSYTWSIIGGWSGTSSTNSISTTASSIGGNITVTSNNACGSSSAQTISITVNASPTISVTSGSICSGQSFTMVPSGASTYTYSSGSSTVAPITNTSYTVIGTDINGCENNAISSVTVNTLPPVSIASSNSISCTSQTVTLTASGATAYIWSNSSMGASISVSPTTTTTYTVIGTDTNGCENMATLTQTVSTCTGIENQLLTVNSISLNIFPNPTSDQLNISGLNKNQKTLFITNILGEVVNKIETNGSDTLSIDVKNLTPGVYFIKTEASTFKFIKN